MLKLPLILIFLSISSSADQAASTTQGNIVMTVDHLINNASKYASKIVDVRGEIIMDYHGRTLCDAKGAPCLFVILPEDVVPKPDFELEKDHMYEEYERLSSEIGLVQKKLGKAELFATLRGRFDIFTLLPNGKEVIAQNAKKGSLVRCRFVLQKVLKIDVRARDKDNR